ncbi:putative glycosyltransferase protein [Parvularcula bermudensis HTCC2503]|uniref:Putative glycosyltransferase protein n=1 Tax=Parvularcula bermudensis (strain ATCC BAA-594 / HTCC2503 / KCTC 12087) TaxID=314260 RepID=E0TI86_PARBH|nr:glycosyltransferase family A protein [Parvularcula bermudensis]ADM09425.1 putative glycosyltransferase protein [Parvularcula bermudensis HTCC2503]
MKLTIGIKALNEEAKIAQAIESALSSLEGIEGEVVLADSGSTDQTIAIAQTYPIRIVQLKNTDERCCGAGAQLAFQAARGEYFYLLDGDMELAPGFIQEALTFLENHPDVAGVGGAVREVNTDGEGFQIRAQAWAAAAEAAERDVDRLDCGGLYRRIAVEAADFFADRNLHAFEEFDLAARLRCRGWRLVRLGRPGVLHYGHQVGGYRLLLRRLKSGYAGAPGEVLRGALGRPHLGIVLRRLGHIRNALVVMAWWVAIVVSAGLLSLWVSLGLILAPIGFLWWRRGSLSLGIYSLAAWNVAAIGLVTGFFRRRVSPQKSLELIDCSTEQP